MFRHYATALVLILSTVITGCDDVPDLSLPNEPPVAVDDNVTIRQNDVANILVGLNDFDIDGDTVTISNVSDPSNGVVENLGGSIRYTPELYFIGNDTFTYDLSDTIGQTVTATVFIEVSKRQARAIFSTGSGTGQKLYMVASDAAGTLVDLGQSLAAGEQVLNWAISERYELAVLLTDSDRILTIPLDDPATPANIFDIDTTSGAVDGGLVLSAVGPGAAYTLGNRYVVYFLLDDDTFVPVEFDTAFTGTMTPSFMSPLASLLATDTNVIMEGTLGVGADERSAIYSVSFAGQTPISILDDDTILQSTVTRALTGTNTMLWLTDSAATAPPQAAYDCAMPPPQTLSAVSFASLEAPGPGTDLISSSGLLADPTSLISYTNSRQSTGLFVAACPPDTDIVQIIEIPFLAPASARIVATADDVSDGLWTVDVASGNQTAIFVLDGNTGLRTQMIDLSGTDPVISDITSVVPDFQTYTVNSTLRLPPSLFSADALRWLFLAPVNDELTKLQWLQLATMQLTSVDLPFPASNLVSDGFYAVVQGATGDTGPGPIALVDLSNSQITMVNVNGVLIETLTDPLNQIKSAINLYATP